MLVELPIWIIKHEKKLISVHFRAICFLPSFCEADARNRDIIYSTKFLVRKMLRVQTVLKSRMLNASNNKLMLHNTLT